MGKTHVGEDIYKGTIFHTYSVALGCVSWLSRDWLARLRFMDLSGQCLLHQLAMIAIRQTMAQDELMDMIDEFFKMNHEYHQALVDYRSHLRERLRAAVVKSEEEVKKELIFHTGIKIRVHWTARLVSPEPLVEWESVMYCETDQDSMDQDSTDVDMAIPEKVMEALRSDGKAEQLNEQFKTKFASVNDELKAKLAPRIRAIILEAESAHGAAQLVKPILMDITYTKTLSTRIKF